MRFDIREGCILLSFLLLVNGCQSIPGASPLSSPLASPIDSVFATSPVAAPTPSSTETPLPTATPFIPSPTPTSTPSPDTITGWGNFPRIAAVLGKALYLVQGNTATFLLDFGDITDREIYFYYQAHTKVRFSPNSQYVAYLFDTSIGATVLGYVDIQEQENHILKITGNLQEPTGRGEPSGFINSFVWMDNQSIVYTNLRGIDCLAELWLIDLENAAETKLAGDEVLKVLGVSDNGDRISFLRGVLCDESRHYSEALASLDLDSGAVTPVLPPTPDEGGRYVNFTSVTMPDTTRRILAAEIGPGMTVVSEKPKIWMVDLRNNSSDVIWTITQGRGLGTKGGTDLGTSYDCPRDFIWSPSSEFKFVYLAQGGFGGVWMVDLQSGSTVQILEFREQILLAWSSDGIVTESFPWFDKLTLWSETGEVIGEIEF
jgi:hypothetical protein